ncbi:MAG: hypothetical protein ACLR6S_11060 [Lacrimispora saccharolytica]
MLTKKYPSTTRIVGIVLRSYIPNSGDGTITTGRGMGAAVDFSLELLTQLQGKEAAEEMAEKIIAR